MVPQRESQNFQAGGQFQPVGGLLESQERAILEEIASPQKEVHLLVDSLFDHV